MSCLTHTWVCSRQPSPRGAQAAAGGGHPAQRRQRLRRGTRGRRRGPGGRRGRRRGQTQGHLRALWGSGGAVGTLISAPAQRHAGQSERTGPGTSAGLRRSAGCAQGTWLQSESLTQHIGRHLCAPISLPEPRKLALEAFACSALRAPCARPPGAPRPGHDRLDPVHRSRARNPAIRTCTQLRQLCEAPVCSSRWAAVRARLARDARVLALAQAPEIDTAPPATTRTSSPCARR